MLGRRPFQYNMLLRVRKRQEDVCAQVLASTRRDLRVAEHRREEIEREQMQMLEDAGKAAASGVSASDIRRFYQYERHLAYVATRTDARIRELQNEVDKRRLDLDEAMKRRRILERLKERRQAALQAGLLKDEQAMSDEVATSHVALDRSLSRAAAAHARDLTERGTL